MLFGKSDKLLFAGFLACSKISFIKGCIVNFVGQVSLLNIFSWNANSRKMD